MIEKKGTAKRVMMKKKVKGKKVDSDLVVTPTLKRGVIGFTMSQVFLKYRIFGVRHVLKKKDKLNRLPSGIEKLQVRSHHWNAV